jgi:hypothetical protein
MDDASTSKRKAETGAAENGATSKKKKKKMAMSTRQLSKMVSDRMQRNVQGTLQRTSTQSAQ